MSYLTSEIVSLFSHYSKAILLSLPLTMYSGLNHAQEIPNILLIQVDDLGIGDLAVNGNSFIETPNIDKLAGEAISYKDFYVNALCAPSRAAMLTGRDFWKTGVSGVHGGRDYVNLNEVMFPELLKQSGYETGMWGKWHSGKTDGYFPWDRGFDEAYYATLYNHFNNIGVLNGERVETEGWATDRITDFAVDFIKRNSEKKFFAYVSYMAPHEPWYASDEYTEKYMNKGLSKALSTLYGMIDQVDFNVGRLLKTLEESGVDKSTVIIFLSDNGPVQTCSRFGKLSEEDWGLRNPHGLRGAKGTLWENGVKAPLYIRWKGKTVPYIQSGICSITDIFPTILNLAGIDATKVNGSLNGEDLKPLEPDSFQSENRVIFRSTHYPRFPEEFAQNGERNLPYYPIDSNIKESLSADDQTISVRDDRFKLVHQDSIDFLFDMFLDPRETSPVNDKEDIKEKLKNQFQHWFQEVKNEPHAFGGPVHQIGFDGRKETKIYACSPSEVSSHLNNRGHYLGFWRQKGDSVKYKINVCTPGKYQINLVYRIQPYHEYSFTVSAGLDRISRSFNRIEKDAWFDALFEQESAYGDMNKIGNAKIGVVQLNQDIHELKIELDEVLVKQGQQADFQLLTINFTRIDELQPDIEVFQQDTGSDKIVSMEAEHYLDNVDGSGDYSTHSWISTSTPAGYTGNKAMVTHPNISTNISIASDAEFSAPTLRYVVNFLTPGTHYIWLRVNTDSSGGDNSIHAGLNGTISAERLECGTSPDWVWKSYKADGNRPTINVPSTGEHTFCLFMREDGMRVDKIVLTTNVDFIPTGIGPAESGQSGAGSLAVTPISNNQISLNIFPNPSSGNIHLDFGSNKVEDVQINILNMMGQQLISETNKSVQLDNGIDLSLEGLEKGIYLIQCKIAGQTQTTKLIKE